MPCKVFILVDKDRLAEFFRDLFRIGEPPLVVCGDPGTCQSPVTIEQYGGNRVGKQLTRQ
jgi:hypothetical protein